MDVEQQVADHLDAGSFREAATLSLRTWGDVVFGFLVHRLRDEGEAAEVFSQLTEDFWRGLAAFQRRCSVRTWLYLLARNAASRFRRAPWNLSGRRTGDAAFGDMVASIRSRTPAWLRSEVKDRFAELREALDPDDRSLLALRIDRRLPWEDIALIFLEDEAPDREGLKRESARLRKRFQFVKEELRRKALERGLIEKFTD